MSSKPMKNSIPDNGAQGPLAYPPTVEIDGNLDL